MLLVVDWDVATPILLGIWFIGLWALVLWDYFKNGGNR